MQINWKWFAAEPISIHEIKINFIDDYIKFIFESREGI